jgi:hypothetical protein
MAADDGPGLPPAIIAKLNRLGGGGRHPVLMRVVEVLRAIDVELVVLQRLLAVMRAEGVE